MKTCLIALAAAPAAGLMVELAVDLNSPDMEASVRGRRDVNSYRLSIHARVVLLGFEHPPGLWVVRGVPGS